VKLRWNASRLLLPFAGRIDGSLQAQGIRVALGDLLIGATALELGYSVLTGNVRHFQKIPGLDVIAQ
jgi:predicted nucleic acid-binding protein